jgi:hypothetical protein
MRVTTGTVWLSIVLLPGAGCAPYSHVGEHQAPRDLVRVCENSPTTGTSSARAPTCYAVDRVDLARVLSGRR